MSEKFAQALLHTELINNSFKEENIHYSLDTDTLQEIFDGCSKKHTKEHGIPDCIYYTDEVFIIFEAKSKNMKCAINDLFHYLKNFKRELIPHSNIYGVACVGTPASIFEYKIFDVGCCATLLRLDDLINESSSLKHTKNINTNQQMEKYISKIHNKIRGELSLSNDDKPLLISGILISMTDKDFVNGIGTIKSHDMINSLLMTSIKNQKKKYLGHDEFDITNYKFIISHVSLAKSNVLHSLISDLSTNVEINSDDKDILNLFYTEFLKYYSTDSKSLGIVLTPDEYVKFMVSLLDIQPTDKVLDLCTGTGSFLLESLKYNPSKIIGCEFQSKLYDLFVDNCIIRDCRNFRAYHSDCFNVEFEENITKSVINPPYSQKTTGKKELDFILKQLNSLEKGGIGISIIPIGKVSANKQNEKLKKDLLDNHTLICSIKLVKKDLFYSVGVECCILIFKAHIPNSGESLFINFEDDGMIKVKNVGRRDINGVFESKSKEIIDIYNSRKEVPGLSLLKHVTHLDDWNYNAFSSSLNNDVSLLEVNCKLNELESALLRVNVKDAIYEIKESSHQERINYKQFKIGEVFNVTKGKNQLSKLNSVNSRKDGMYPIISAKNNSNGIAGFAKDGIITYKNKLTVNSRGNGGVGCCFYHPYDFYATSLVFILEYKHEIIKDYDNVWTYIASAIEMNRYKYSFGRGITLENLLNDEVCLPSNNGKIDFDKILELIQ